MIVTRGIKNTIIILLSVIGAFLLPLLPAKIVKYLAGLGWFIIFFLFIYAIIPNANLCAMISMTLSILVIVFYEKILKIDENSATIIILIAVAGLSLAASILLNITIKTPSVNLHKAEKAILEKLDYIKWLQNITKKIK